MSNASEHAMSHAVLPRAGTNRKDKSEEHIKDETVGGKRIEGNIHYRNHVLAMQDAKNYHMERDRLHGILAENRIPANRHIVRKRIKQLDDKISELDEDKK
jgi:hypothetical protein